MISRGQGMGPMGQSGMLGDMYGFPSNDISTVDTARLHYGHVPLHFYQSNMGPDQDDGLVQKNYMFKFRFNVVRKCSSFML